MKRATANFLGVGKGPEVLCHGSGTGDSAPLPAPMKGSHTETMDPF